MLLAPLAESTSQSATIFEPALAALATSAVPLPPTPIPAALIRSFAPHTRDGMN